MPDVEGGHLGGRGPEDVPVVDADEVAVEAIDVVGALAEVEIDDVDGIDPLDLGIGPALLDVLGDELRGPIDHALEVVHLRLVLDLDEHELPLGGLGQQVHPVVLVVARLLVALALEDADDGDLEAKELGQEALED